MSKRLLYGLIIGLSTFALGLGVASLFNAWRPVSLCEIAANPEYYAGRIVRFRAVIDRNRYDSTATALCRSGEMVGASVELDTAEESTFPLPEPTRSGDGEIISRHLMDAEMVGQLEEFNGTSCFGPMYHISGARVERVFSLLQFNDSEEELRWLKSNSY